MGFLGTGSFWSQTRDCHWEASPVSGRGLIVQDVALDVGTLQVSQPTEIPFRGAHSWAQIVFGASFHETRRNPIHHSKGRTRRDNPASKLAAQRRAPRLIYEAFI